MDNNDLKTILLVEDEAIIALVEKKILEKYGYSVIHAGSGEKAIEFIQSGTPVDLILMDIDLGSGIDGTIAAERILEIRDIPLVFLSSHTEPEVVEKTEGITSYGYIVKNSGETVLVAAIRMAFRLFETKLKVQSHLNQQEILVEILMEFHKRMNQPFEELMDYAIEVSLKLTGSAFSFAGLMNEDETVMTIHAWSAGAMESCSIEKTPIKFPIPEAGVWGECIRQRKPVIINNYNDYAGKNGYPEGHVPVTSFMAVPVFDGNRITAVGAVANKFTGYEMSDVQSLISVYEKLWEIIRRKESEESLRESNERFKALHNASFGGITIHDKGIILECNQGLADMTGYSADELIGMDGLLLIAEKSRDQVMKNILAGYEKPYEAFGLRKNGEEFPMRLEARNVPYKGKMVRTVEFRDITEIKKSEEALRRSEEKYHALFEDSPEPYLIMDDAVIVECNRATELLLRCERSEIIGKTPYDFSPEFQPDGLSSREGVERKIEEVLNRGRVFFEWLHKRPDSTEFRAEVSLSLIYLENKTVIFANWRDISDKIFALNLMEKAVNRFKALLENSSSLISIFDSDGRYVDVSRALANALNLSPSDIRGKTFHDLLPGESADNFMETINKIRNGERLVIKNDTIIINGEERVYESRVFPIDIQHENRELYGTIAIDITERKKIEADNIREIKINRALVEASQMILQSSDFVHTARGIFNAVCDLTGAVAGYIALLNDKGDENEIVYLDSGGYPCTVDPSLPMPVRGLRSVAYHSKKGVYDNNFESSEWMKYMPEGHSPLKNVLFAPLIIEGEAVGLIGIANKPEPFTDEDLKLTEIFAHIAAVALNNSRMYEKLNGEKDRYKRLFESANDAIFLHTLTDKNMPGRIIDVNQKACNMLGYSRDKLVSLSVKDISPPEVWDASYDITNKIFHNREMTFESMQIRQDGSVFPVEVSAYYFTEGDEKFILSHCRDITDRKESEKSLAESNEKFMKFFMENPAGMLITSLNDFRIVDVNDSMTELSGYSRDEFIGNNAVLLNLWVNPDDRSRVIEIISETGSVRNFECMFRLKNGELRWGSYGSNIIDINGEKSLLVVIDDITDRKEAEERIQVLLKETHHRVKNNMNTVYGLLYMQAQEMEDSLSRNNIMEAASRVQSMMLLYDRLYRSAEFTEVNIREYLSQMINEMTAIFDSGIPVKTEVKLDEIVLNAKTVSALGILINELITNSMKYAFHDLNEGLITLSLTENDKNVTLVYSDNGPGLPESLDLENPSGFGIQLVMMLVRQLKGSIVIEKKPLKFTIRFSIQ